MRQIPFYTAVQNALDEIDSISGRAGFFAYSQMVDFSSYVGDGNARAENVNNQLNMIRNLDLVLGDFEARLMRLYDISSESALVRIDHIIQIFNATAGPSRGPAYINGLISALQSAMPTDTTARESIIEYLQANNVSAERIRMTNTWRTDLLVERYRRIAREPMLQRAGIEQARIDNIIFIDANLPRGNLTSQDEMVLYEFLILYDGRLLWEEGPGPRPFN